MIGTVDVAAADWRRRVRDLLDADARFATLYAGADGAVRFVAISGDGNPTVLRAPVGGPLDSVIDLVPAAGWAEREAHDLFGVAFAGHEPMRPLVMHREDWKVQVTGEGVHEIAVGPIHAGIIESGHFRIHAVGELILLVDVRLFYKHRGLERAAEGASLRDGIRFALRACAGCAVANSLAYALAAEQILGVQPDPAIARARTILLELERLWNHLNDLSAICAGVGFAAGAMAFAALKEDAQRMNQRVFGHRFLFGAVAVAGDPGDGAASARISPEGARDIRETLAHIARELDVAWRAVMFNASVMERLTGTGVLANKAAVRSGTVGPAARASGVNIDARATASRLAYEGFAPVPIEDAGGDVRARAIVRHRELLATLAMLDVLVGEAARWESRDAGMAAAVDYHHDNGLGIGVVESARGQTVCCVEASGGSIDRLHLRTASFANWPSVAEAAAGNLVGEFPLVNKSFELCYACVDR